MSLAEFGRHRQLVVEVCEGAVWVECSCVEDSLCGLFYFCLLLGCGITPRDLSQYYKKQKDHKYTKNDFLKEVFITESDYDKLRSLVIRKKNVILQGAPGVGKTFSANPKEHNSSDIVEIKTEFVGISLEH